MKTESQNRRRFIAWSLAILLFSAVFSGAVVTTGSNSFDRDQSEALVLAERLLNLQYRAEFQVGEFDRRLDDLRAEKQAHPERDLDPLATAEYRALTRTWMAIRDVSH